MSVQWRDRQCKAWVLPAGSRGTRGQTPLHHALAVGGVSYPHPSYPSIGWPSRATGQLTLHCSHHLWARQSVCLAPGIGPSTSWAWSSLEQRGHQEPRGTSRILSRSTSAVPSMPYLLHSPPQLQAPPSSCWPCTVTTPMHLLVPLLGALWPLPLAKFIHICLGAFSSVLSFPIRTTFQGL